jgi:putative inorganic carbon (hco3(-)) transporter
MSVPVPTLRKRDVRSAGRVALLTAAGPVVGASLAAIGLRFGDAAPWVILALGASPLLVMSVMRVPAIAILLVIAVFPVGAVGYATGIMNVQTVELAAAIAVGLVALQMVTSRPQHVAAWSTPLWWVATLFLWAVVALPSALDTGLAVKQVAALGAGVVYAAAVIAACRSMRDVRLVLGAFVAVVTAIALGAFFGVGDLQANFGGAQVVGRAVSTFDHPNQLGSVSALGIAVGLGFFLTSSDRRVQLATAVALPVLLGGLLFSLSRGAWIGTAAALVVIGIWLPMVRRRLVALATPLVVAAVLGALFLPAEAAHVVGQRVSALIDRSPHDDRLEIWGEALREIAADPVTGQGPGNFPVSSRAETVRSVLFAPLHAHNVLLTWGAETGLPGAVLVVGFVIAIWRTVRRMRLRVPRNDPDVVLLVIGAAGLLALLIQGVVDYTLRNAVVFFAFWTVAATIMAGERLSASHPRARPLDRPVTGF